MNRSVRSDLPCLPKITNRHPTRLAVDSWLCRNNGCRNSGLSQFWEREREVMTTMSRVILAVSLFGKQLILCIMAACPDKIVVPSCSEYQMKSIHFSRWYARRTIFTFSFPVFVTFDLLISKIALPFSSVWSYLLLKYELSTAYWVNEGHVTDRQTDSSKITRFRW